ncbi:DNA-invertase [Gloeobacter kilaueensis JS1]|uniref:DNA-invertase n=1 Tax=Gloeobacter kilaueensis (strain ATCC BAA-2537 / CCAP 1431/1 / ULC 316 / JS1) TaxID=1183438 RepID=U5QIY5_GLOK1|nr:DNA-invertase [Gloeobacter kilaueensis JS1]
MLEHGDTLIVWKLNRLGRSVRDLITMLDELQQRRVQFQSLTEHIETTTPTGWATWHMLAVLAELERSVISERTQAGVKAAKKRGVKFGPKHKLSAAQVAYARQ